MSASSLSFSRSASSGQRSTKHQQPSSSLPTKPGAAQKCTGAEKSASIDCESKRSAKERPAESNALEDQDLDFIGSSHAVKDLFSLPYDLGRPVSVALHNVGGTLLIDADHGSHLVDHADTTEEKKSAFSLYASEKSPKSLEANHGEVSNALVALSSLELESEALSLVNSVIRKSRNSSKENDADSDDKSLSASELSDSREPTVSLDLPLPPPDAYVRSYIPSVPEPREYLTWKFRDMNLLVGSSAVIYRSPEAALAVRVEEASDLRAMLVHHEELKRSGQFLPDYEHHQLPSTLERSYADAARRSLRENLDSTKANESVVAATSCAESFSAPNLAQVRLQTCIVAAPNSPVGGLLSDHLPFRQKPSSLSTVTKNSVPSRDTRSPVSTVLDIYLDNIMANVPQLALCLQEKGFVQSVKLFQTDEIPAGLLSARAVDTTTPFDVIQGPESDQVFSPKIMETNASTLLRFLKTNCSRDNSTYLLRREAGQTNIQLYDITTISAQRQRQWVWWLAMMSYRFANRLRHVAASIVKDNVLRRNSRARQRSLLQNTLELLEVLADMDGNKHESLVSAVCESLADTFLVVEDEERLHAPVKTSTAIPQTHPPPATTVAFTKQPYGSLSADALNKAQDHLKHAIKGLEGVLHEQVKTLGLLPQGRPVYQNSGCSSHSDESIQRPAPSSTFRQVEPVVTQLFGLHHKFVNVSLRLAEIHLRNYYSSSAMQALRLSARTISASLFLAQLLDGNEPTRVADWLGRIQLQATWLWEHCGHFARSFAADALWRERGHTSGEDIISVLQDAEKELVNVKGGANYPDLVSRFFRPETPLSRKSLDLVNLYSLSGVVNFAPPIGKISAAEKRSDDTESYLGLARTVLEEQSLLHREKRRVLVASAVAYHHAIQSFRGDLQRSVNRESVNNGVSADSTLLKLLQQRLGDACNETGKILLNEARLVLTSSSGSRGKKLEGEDLNAVAEGLLSSAQFWFIESMSAFQDCEDSRNLALLRCNLCQSYKLRANHVFSPLRAPVASGSQQQGPTHAELCLQEAASHLQAAHESLGEREFDSLTWDMVSEELAATFLVLGVRRRQSLIGSGNGHLLIMQALRLSPGKEHSIVDPMERARTIYQQLGNRHQVAACHYQLAMYYSKIWPCQSDEGKTREKLASAFSHYNAALSYFASSIRGNEVTYALLCLDLSKLYSIVSGLDSARKALQVCLASEDAFSRAAVESASALASRDEWFRQMETLASSMEEAVFKLLRTLVKLEDEGNRKETNVGDTPSAPPSHCSSTYKDLYRTALQAKLAFSVTAGSPSVSAGAESSGKVAARLAAVNHILRSLRAKV